MGKRKVKVYIAASLDGYIAHSDGDIDWLDSVARPDEDYGYAAFIETIDTAIMGRKKPGKDIFIDGGSEAIDLFREKGLIDSYTVSIIPILLGEGIPLFKESKKEHPLKLVEATTFDSGLVQLNYEPAKI